MTILVKIVEVAYDIVSGNKLVVVEGSALNLEKRSYVPEYAELNCKLK